MAENEAPTSAKTNLPYGPSLKISTALGGTCWYAKGEVTSSEINWLVDTGATTNVLDHQTYLDLPISSHFPLKPVDAMFHAADGNPLNIYGEIKLPVKFDHTTIALRAIVADLGGIQGILGMSFLEKHNCTLDLSGGHIVSPKFVLNLYKLENTSFSSLHLQETVCIPPGYSKIAMACLETVTTWPSEETEGLLEPEPSLGAAGLLVPRALVGVQPDTSVGIAITNVGEEEITLAPGLRLGSLLSICDVTVCPISQSCDLETTSASTKLPDHLQPLLNNVSPKLNEQETQEVEQLLLSYSDVFVCPDGKLR